MQWGSAAGRHVDETTGVWKVEVLSCLIGLVDELESLCTLEFLEHGEDQSYSSEHGGSSSMHPSPIPKVLIAMLVLAQAASGERIIEDQSVVVYGSGVSVDYGLATWMLFWILVLLGVMSWEALKWIAWMIYDRAAPGASARSFADFSD